jgi:hypothetical protein
LLPANRQTEKSNLIIRQNSHGYETNILRNLLALTNSKWRKEIVLIPKRAVPALLLGLRSSSITVGGDGTLSHGFLHGATVGSSILFTVLTKLSLGDAARYGALVQLSPLAFAGWLGLFITALNLLPVGQLDGGSYHARNVRESGRQYDQ